MSKLDQIIEEFAGLDPRERLELLAEFSDKLAPLPERFQSQKDRGDHRVHECQTPVFIWVELVDGRVKLYADVAPEAPTVKGFVSILEEAFTGATVDELLSAPTDLLQRLGLVQALGMMRMHGLQALLHHIRRLTTAAASAAATSAE
jgi:cysteine desulfuration protein SufE